MSIVECVPNFSEGKDRTKIDRIVEAIGRAVSYTHLTLPTKA